MLLREKRFEVITGARPYVRKLWTTGEIARLIDLDARFVRRWIDDGKLRSVNLPDVSERRVHREDLRRFLLKYEYWQALREMDTEEGVTREYPGDVDDAPPPPAKPPRKPRP